MQLGISASDPGLMDLINAKAAPYFQRGYRAVMEKRNIRTLDEAVAIIKANFAKAGIDPSWGEPFANAFARAYIAGVEAARAETN